MTAPPAAAPAGWADVHRRAAQLRDRRHTHARGVHVDGARRDGAVRHIDRLIAAAADTGHVRLSVALAEHRDRLADRLASDWRYAHTTAAATRRSHVDVHRHAARIRDDHPGLDDDE